MTLSFQDTRHRQMSIAIKWPNHGRLVDTVEFQAASVHLQAHGGAPCNIISNTPQHVGVDLCHSCLKSCHEIFCSPERDCVKLLLQITSQKSTGVRSGYQGGHAFSPPRPIHLLGHVTFNLCLMATGRSASSPGRTFSKNSLYRRAVSLSGSRQGPTAVSPTVPAQTLKLRRTWEPRSWIPRRLFRARRCRGLWTHRHE